MTLEEHIFRQLFIDVVLEFVVKIIWEEDPRIHSPSEDVAIFSNISDSTQKQTRCPKCQRVVAVVRFAPHLEKCLGMGRQAALPKPFIHK